MVFSHTCSLQCSLLPTVFQPKTGLQTQNYPFCLAHVHPHLIRQCFGRPYSPCKRQLHRCTQFHTTIHQTSHWLQWNAATPQKLPLPLRQSPPKSNTPIQSLPHPPSQRHLDQLCRFATIPNADRQTDRPTDGIERMFHHVSHLCSLIFSFFFSLHSKM